MLEPTSLHGGTQAPGVPRAVFAMPTGSIIRYDRPAPEIADFVTGYHLYAAHGPDSLNKVDWFLPGTANIRVTLGAGPVAVSVGRRDYDPLPDVALFGPTSRVMRAVSNGGVMIGFGISALGWARLFDRPAISYHDVIAPLAKLTGPDLPRDLVERLSEMTDEESLKPALDALLQPLLASPNVDEPVIRGLMIHLVDPEIVQVRQLVDRIGVDQAVLRRVATRYFGMCPKLLLRRARFLRSFTAMFRSPDAQGYRGIDSSYHDASHFLRDAERFLGMTPRRFMALSTPFLDASVRARAAVLGSPTQALHDIDTAPARERP
jgi:AraC-like DNA-binding protein